MSDLVLTEVADPRKERSEVTPVSQATHSSPVGAPQPPLVKEDACNRPSDQKYEESLLQLVEKTVTGIDPPSGDTGLSQPVESPGVSATSNVRSTRLRPAPMLGINDSQVEVLETPEGFTVESPNNSFAVTGDARVIRRLRRILFV